MGLWLGLGVAQILGAVLSMCRKNKRFNPFIVLIIVLLSMKKGNEILLKGNFTPNLSLRG